MPSFLASVYGVQRGIDGVSGATQFAKCQRGPTVSYARGLVDMDLKKSIGMLRAVFGPSRASRDGSDALMLVGAKPKNMPKFFAAGGGRKGVKPPSAASCGMTVELPFAASCARKGGAPKGVRLSLAAQCAVARKRFGPLAAACGARKAAKLPFATGAGVRRGVKGTRPVQRPAAACGARVGVKLPVAARGARRGVGSGGRRDQKRSACLFGVPLAVGRQQRSRCGSEDLSRTALRLAAGDSREGEAQHLKRHPAQSIRKWAKTCPRCAFSLWRSNNPRVAPWLVAKPPWMGGAWGLGCGLCAAGVTSEGVKQRRRQLRVECKKEGFKKQAVSRFSSWARYGVGRILAPRVFASAIVMHEGVDLHRICKAVLSSPAAHIERCRANHTTSTGTQRAVSLMCSAHDLKFEASSVAAAPCGAFVDAGKVGSVTDPFRGRVPQVEDWQSVWAEASSCVSVLKQTRVAKKKLETARRSRIARRKMIGVMAEVTRENTRKRLREATSVTVALDECKGRKIIRVRCDTPDAPYRYDGILGVVMRTYGSEGDVAAEVRGDHAENAARLLEECHRRFFTPMPSKRQSACGDEQRKRCNDDELGAFRRKVRILAADGGSAERRAVFLAAERYYPRVAQVIRDPAHGIRIAIQKPPRLEDVYGKVYEELLNKRHALIPDIQNSGKWQKILEGIQTNVLRMPCMELPGCLKVVLGHLAFAKQRMDSCADPLAKFCLMLMPIGLLLAFIASDERCQRPQRERALAMLQHFKPKFMHACGISADWGLISIEFLRLFDRMNHDIANSKDEMQDFCETITACFIEGRIFSGVSVEPACGGADRKKAMFITERVRKQTLAKCVFHCGSKQQIVWGAIGEADLKDLSMRARVQAETTLTRVRAELAGLRQDYSCFAVRRVAVVFAPNAAAANAMKAALLASVRALGRAFVLDVRVLQLEYVDALPVVNALWQAALISDSTTKEKWFDNRRIWNRLLDNRFVGKHFPSRAAPFTVLLELIRIWGSVLDGECQVERDLGQMRAFLDESSNVGDDALEDLLLLKLNGPQEPEEVATRAACGAVCRPTPFTNRCVALWRATYGQRYGLDKRLRKPRATGQGAVARKKLSFTEAKRAVLRAAASARASAKRRRLDPSTRTAYGVTAGFFMASPLEKKERTPAWNDALKKFDEQSKRMRVKNMLGRMGRSAMPKWKARPAFVAASNLTYVRSLAYLPARDQAACGAVPVGYEERSGVQRCRYAHMVLFDSLERLDADVAEEEWVVHLLYIVAKGLPITTQACAARVGGQVRRLNLTEIIAHSPMKTLSVEFLLADRFRRQHPSVVSSLSACSALDGSEWRTVRDFSRAPARGGAQPKAPARGGARGTKKKEQVRVDDLTSLWEWLKATRRMVNSQHVRMAWRKEKPCGI